MSEERVLLNDNVRTICAAHFDEKDSGCAKCPIKAACHSGPTARLTVETMNEWRRRFNVAADSVRAIAAIRERIAKP